MDTPSPEKVQTRTQRYKAKIKADPLRCNACGRRWEGETALCAVCLGKRAAYHARKKSDPEYIARRQEKLRQWRKANPDRAQVHSRRNYLRHKEARIAYVREYRRANPEWNTERQRRRRAKKKAVLNDLTQAQWLAIWDSYEGLCCYCGQPAAEMDHVVPLDRGGPHTASNVVPACRPCNASKGAKLLSEWTPPHDGR